METSDETKGAAELARLLADLPLRIAYARQAARDPEPLDAAIRDLADGAELLLAEHERLTTSAMCEKNRELIDLLDTAEEERDALRARVAKLEAERTRVLDAIRPLFPEVPASRSADVFARLLVTRNREGWAEVERYTYEEIERKAAPKGDT